MEELAYIVIPEKTTKKKKRKKKKEESHDRQTHTRRKSQ